MTRSEGKESYAIKSGLRLDIGIHKGPGRGTFDQEPSTS